MIHVDAKAMEDDIVALLGQAPAGVLNVALYLDGHQIGTTMVLIEVDDEGVVWASTQRSVYEIGRTG
jgi:hypothetical protein